MYSVKLNWPPGTSVCAGARICTVLGATHIAHPLILVMDTILVNVFLVYFY